MPILSAILVLLLFQWLGDSAVQLSGLPLPGALAGMVLLLVALSASRRQTPDGLQRTAGQMLRHMMLMLVPAVAGIVMHLDTLAREWLPFLAACIGGAALTLWVTVLVFHWSARVLSTRKDAS